MAIKTSAPNPTNNPEKAGQLAGTRETFGPHGRYVVAPVHTRFDVVEWFVWDAEGEPSRMLAMPPVIRQEATKAKAMANLDCPLCEEGILHDHKSLPTSKWGR